MFRNLTMRRMIMAVFAVFMIAGAFQATAGASISQCSSGRFCQWNHANFVSLYRSDVGNASGYAAIGTSMYNHGTSGYEF